MSPIEFAIDEIRKKTCVLNEAYMTRPNLKCSEKSGGAQDPVPVRRVCGKTRKMVGSNLSG